IDVIDLNVHLMSIDAEPCPDRYVTQRGNERQRYRFDARESAEAALERIEICLRSSWRVAVPGEPRVNRNDLLVFKARMGGHCMIQRPAQKSRHDQQYAARRDLRADQHLPRDDCAMALPAGLQSRHQPEELPGCEYSANGENSVPPIRRWIEPCRASGEYHQ